MTFNRKQAHHALHPHIGNQSQRVHLQLVKFQGINLHHSAKERQQLHVYHHLAHIGNGVGIVNHLHPLNTQVERKLQAHLLNAHLLSCFF